MRLLRAVSLAAIVVGAAGTVVLMRRVGQRTPLFLLALFLVWDLSPFAGLAVAALRSTRWPAPARATLYVLTLLITAGSLAIYANPTESQPAFVFLVVPLGAWLLIGSVLPLAARLSRRRALPDV